EFETWARGTVIRTPTGLGRLLGERVEGQPRMPPIDWEEMVVRALQKLRKDQGLNDQSPVKVAPDGDLYFGTAVAVLGCCRRAACRQAELAPDEPRKVVVAVGRDGAITVDGDRVAPERIQALLAERAVAVGGADKVVVAVRAHPQAKYAAVA